MTITYEAWVKHIFDHPLPPEVDDAIKQAHYQKLHERSLKLMNGDLRYEDIRDDVDTPDWVEWYFHMDAPYLEPEPEQIVDYTTRIFNSIDVIAGSYSDGQMNQGINYLINNSCSNFIFALVDETVALDKRLKAVESFYSVYEKLYEPKCDKILGHLSEDGNPLNSTCYMWWDVIPFYGKSGEDIREQLDKPMIQVMERCLSLKNDACLEGALHGSGHWKIAYPQEIEAIIDAFLAQNPDIRPELKQYALSARDGCVL